MKNVEEYELEQESIVWCAALLNLLWFFVCFLFLLLLHERSQGLSYPQCANCLDSLCFSFEGVPFFSVL